MAISLFVLALASGASARAAMSAPMPASTENCAPIDSASVAGFFDQWNLSLATLDADAVTARYWPDAVLLTNGPGSPRTNPALIRDYFSQFLAKRPRGRIDAHAVQVGCNVAIDAGTYTFSVMDAAGTVSEFPALYTLVYQYRNGIWKILHHHSSVLAEAPGTAPPAAPAAPVLPPVAASTAPPTAVATHPKRAAGTAAANPGSAAAVAGSTAASGAATAAPATGGFTLRTPAEVPAVVGKAPGGAGTAGARGSAGSARSRGHRMAKVDSTPETKPDDGNGARTSWSAMFLNQAGTADVADFYPAEARSRGERGVVSLRVCADPHGKLAGAPEVLKGSGHPDLDAAAGEWARAARWVPATENGSAVEGCTRVSVQFGS